jgi:Tfp pilus assembly protein PilF
MVNLAALHLREGRGAEARELLARAAATTEDPLTRARAYGMMGDAASARAEVAKVLAADPTNSEALALLAQIEKLEKGEE